MTKVNKMKRICAVGVLFCLLFLNKADAQNLIVRIIGQDCNSAILVDSDTGTEYTVNVGTDLEEWKIIEINDTGVVIMSVVASDGLYSTVRKLDKSNEEGFAGCSFE